jgi:hypothetical protein
MNSKSYYANVLILVGLVNHACTFPFGLTQPAADVPKDPFARKMPFQSSQKDLPVPQNSIQQNPLAPGPRLFDPAESPNAADWPTPPPIGGESSVQHSSNVNQNIPVQTDRQNSLSVPPSLPNPSNNMINSNPNPPAFELVTPPPIPQMGHQQDVSKQSTLPKTPGEAHLWAKQHQQNQVQNGKGNPFDSLPIQNTVKPQFQMVQSNNPFDSLPIRSRQRRQSPDISAIANTNAVPPVNPAMPNMPTNGMPNMPTNGMPNMPTNGMPNMPTNGMPNMPTNGMPNMPTNGMPNMPTNGMPNMPTNGMPNMPTNGMPNGMPNVPTNSNSGMPNVPTNPKPGMPNVPSNPAAPNPVPNVPSKTVPNPAVPKQIPNAPMQPPLNPPKPAVPNPNPAVPNPNPAVPNPNPAVPNPNMLSGGPPNQPNPALPIPSPTNPNGLPPSLLNNPGLPKAPVNPKYPPLGSPLKGNPAVSGFPNTNGGVVLGRSPNLPDVREQKIFLPSQLQNQNDLVRDPNNPRKETKPLLPSQLAEMKNFGNGKR